MSQNNNHNVRRKRLRYFTLDEKVNLLQQLEDGETIANLTKIYDIDSANITYIKRIDDYLRHNYRSSSLAGNKIPARELSPEIDRMEKTLNEWITDKLKKYKKVNNDYIRAKALELYTEFKGQDHIDKQTFNANLSWLYMFKSRYNIKNSNSDPNYLPQPNDNPEKFKHYFKDLIDKEDYKPEQVFNADDMKLLWKRLPIDGYTYAPQKMQILLCFNATGDLYLKPLIVYPHANPNGPVISIETVRNIFWSVNSKTIIAEQELMAWFQNCFVPTVKEYLESKGLPFKVLLLIDGALYHSAFKDFKYPNIKVVCFPSLTNLTLQPMEQGIISTFRSNYLKGFLTCLFQYMRLQPEMTLQNSCRAYRIASCLIVIVESIKLLPPQYINACWENLWPEIVHKNPALPLPNEAKELHNILEIIRHLDDACYRNKISDQVPSRRSNTMSSVNTISTSHQSQTQKSNSLIVNNTNNNKVLYNTTNNNPNISLNILNNVEYATASNNSNTRQNNVLINVQYVSTNNNSSICQNNVLNSIQYVNTNNSSNTNQLNILNNTLYSTYKNSNTNQNIVQNFSANSDLTSNQNNVQYASTNNNSTVNLSNVLNNVQYNNTNNNFNIGLNNVLNEVFLNNENTDLNNRDQSNVHIKSQNNELIIIEDNNDQHDVQCNNDSSTISLAENINKIKSKKQEISRKNVNIILATALQFEILVRELDPSQKRSLEVTDELNDLISPYKKIKQQLELFVK